MSTLSENKYRMLKENLSGTLGPAWNFMENFLDEIIKLSMACFESWVSTFQLTNKREMTGQKKERKKGKT